MSALYNILKLLLCFLVLFQLWAVDRPRQIHLNTVVDLLLTSLWNLLLLIAGLLLVRRIKNISVRVSWNWRGRDRPVVGSVHPRFYVLVLSDLLLFLLNFDHQLLGFKIFAPGIHLEAKLL